MELSEFNAVIAPVEGTKLHGKRYEPLYMISANEEPNSAQFDKLPSLRAVFGKDGTATAGNASLHK